MKAYDTIIKTRLKLKKKHKEIYLKSVCIQMSIISLVNVFFISQTRSFPQWTPTPPPSLRR